MRPHFLMTDARHFDVHYQINPWMRPESWRADPVRRRAAALEASAKFRAALEQAGAVVDQVEAVNGLPDLVFPANAAIVLDGKALLARFRHPERQGEEAVFRAAFEGLKARGSVREILELPKDVLQEGAGDCIWDETRGFFWAGYGQRSTENSLPVIAEAFGRKIVGLELATDRFYHLDTCFCPLAGGKLLYYPPAFSGEALRAIEAEIRPENRILASDAEAEGFCVNAVNIGDQVIMAQPRPGLRRKLQAHGFTVTGIDLSPFILSGGGAYCMTLRLDRSSIPAEARSVAA
jgi:N-dimethylarginine dimethylaminohydrolase